MRKRTRRCMWVISIATNAKVRNYRSILSRKPYLDVHNLMTLPYIPNVLFQFQDLLYLFVNNSSREMTIEKEINGPFSILIIGNNAN